jgi:hypothetical protein
MLKLITRFSIFLTASFVLITLPSVLLGKLTNPYVAMVMLAHGRSNIADGANRKIISTDLGRSLRFRHHLPFTHISEVMFAPVRHQVLVATILSDFKARRFERGFYLHNILTGKTLELTFLSGDQFHGNWGGYFPAFSRQGDKIAYFDPVDHWLYMYDLHTEQKNPVKQFDADFVTVSWSNDGTNFAVASEKVLSVFRIDGSLVFEIVLQRPDFYPVWTEDGRYLFTDYFTSQYSQNPPIDVFDAQTGEKIQLKGAPAGNNVNLGRCSSRWLTYVYDEANLRKGYVLEMTTGEKLLLNDHPALKEQNIDWIVPTEDCNHFLIRSASSRRRYTPYPQPQTYYLADTTLAQVNLVAEDIVPVWMGTEVDKLYYQQYDPSAGKIRLYHRSLIPQEEPSLLAEFDLVEGALRWADDFSFATYLEPPNATRGVDGGRLALLRPDENQTRYLTGADEYAVYYYQYRWRG